HRESAWADGHARSDRESRVAGVRIRAGRRRALACRDHPALCGPLTQALAPGLQDRGAIRGCRSLQCRTWKSSLVVPGCIEVRILLTEGHRWLAKALC